MKRSELRRLFQALIVLLASIGLTAASVTPAVPEPATSRACREVEAPLLPRSSAPLLLRPSASQSPTPRAQPTDQLTNQQTNTCNRPVSDMPPAPDGCPDWAPIAPPPKDPIPPPCITDLRPEWSDWGWGQGVALHIYIDHPELPPTARTLGASAQRTETLGSSAQRTETLGASAQRTETYTKLSRLVRPGEAWELVDADWEVSCGKDEAPLVWALFEVLNQGEWDALDIYASPLPEEYMDILRELAGLRNVIYLPYLEVQP